MNQKTQKGLWSREMAQIEAIKLKIKTFKADLCSNQFGTAREYFQYIGNQLSAIEKQIAVPSKNHSYFDYRRASLKQDLYNLNQEVAIMNRYIDESEDIATDVATKCATITEHLALLHASPDIQHSIFTRAFRFPKASAFENIQNPGFRVWYLVRNKLAYFQSILSLEKRKHNSLANLLLTKNEDFLEIISSDHLVLEGEIGFIVINRLQNLYYNPESNLRTRKITGKKLREIMTPGARESLIHYDEATLMQEIIKLALHAKCHPKNKTLWLGTARAVDAMIAHSKPRCAYFNPPPQHLTWMLNRIWLQAAVNLGYRFRLVEQHFHNIESAILSHNPLKFLEQLLLETRADNEQNTSQYNGNYAPTATTQEVLALMDMGCIGHKDPYNHSISFTPSQMSYQESRFYSQTDTNLFFTQPNSTQGVRIQRSHSLDDLNAASSPPPYRTLREHFITPSTGELVTFSK